MEFASEDADADSCALAPVFRVSASQGAITSHQCPPAPVGRAVPVLWLTFCSQEDGGAGCDWPLPRGRGLSYIDYLSKSGNADF